MIASMMQTPQQGATAILSWTDERAKILADLKKLEPNDRLSLYSSLTKLNSALFESVRGWDSWLRNPTFMDTFSQKELNEIFTSFKEVTISFLEEDIRWTGTKEQGLPKVMKPEKMDGERRYA
jgi:hypothetical protein